MNVKVAGMTAKAANTTVTLAENELRKSLIITANGGDSYVNFGTTAPSGSPPTAFDLKLASGTSREIQNYTGPCKANANSRYIEFV